MSKDEKDSVPPETHCRGDFIIPGPVLPNGNQLVLRHCEDHSVEAGVLIPMEDGKSLPEEARPVVQDSDGYLRLDQSIAEMRECSRKGPAKVATESYRSGWESVFGRKAPVGQA